MSEDKSPMDDKKFQDKYTSKTDPVHGIIFLPKVPGLPVLDSNGDEIKNFKESTKESTKNSFESFASFAFMVAVVFLFHNNGPYSNSFVNFFYKFLVKIDIWLSSLF